MDETQEQSNSRPWLFKKGQSGNPGGKKKGTKSLKARAREYLEGLSDEEAEEYFAGLNKLDVWKMAEGNFKQDIEQEVKGTLTIEISEAIAKKNGIKP